MPGCDHTLMLWEGTASTDRVGTPVQAPLRMDVLDGGPVEGFVGFFDVQFRGSPENPADFAVRAPAPHMQNACPPSMVIPFHLVREQHAMLVDHRSHDDRVLSKELQSLLMAVCFQRELVLANPIIHRVAWYAAIKAMQHTLQAAASVQGTRVTCMLQHPQTLCSSGVDPVCQGCMHATPLNPARIYPAVQVLLSTAPDPTGATHWGQQTFSLHPAVDCAPGDALAGRITVVRKKENHRLMEVITRPCTREGVDCIFQVPGLMKHEVDASSGASDRAPRHQNNAAPCSALQLLTQAASRHVYGGTAPSGQPAPLLCMCGTAPDKQCVLFTGVLPLTLCGGGLKACHN